MDFSVRARILIFLGSRREQMICEKCEEKDMEKQNFNFYDEDAGYGGEEQPKQGGGSFGGDRRYRNLIWLLVLDLFIIGVIIAYQATSGISGKAEKVSEAAGFTSSSSSEKEVVGKLEKEGGEYQIDGDEK